MTTTATAAELSSRPVPPLGGFSFTVLKLEIRRLLRNRRTVIFALVTPSIFFIGDRGRFVFLLIVTHCRHQFRPYRFVIESTC